MVYCWVIWKLGVLFISFIWSSGVKNQFEDYKFYKQNKFKADQSLSDYLEVDRAKTKGTDLEPEIESKTARYKRGSWLANFFEKHSGVKYPILAALVEIYPDKSFEEMSKDLDELMFSYFTRSGLPKLLKDHEYLEDIFNQTNLFNYFLPWITGRFWYHAANYAFGCRLIIKWAAGWCSGFKYHAYIGLILNNNIEIGCKRDETQQALIARCYKAVILRDPKHLGEELQKSRILTEFATAPRIFNCWIVHSIFGSALIDVCQICFMRAIIMGWDVCHLQHIRMVFVLLIEGDYEALNELIQKFWFFLSQTCFSIVRKGFVWTWNNPVKAILRTLGISVTIMMLYWVLPLIYQCLIELIGQIIHLFY